MSIHMMKLVVGIGSLEEFAEHLARHCVDYEGEQASVIWTRHRPKRSEELVRDGSVYRVIKNRIVCRQRILGFEEAEHPVKGKMCLIMVSPEIIQTMSQVQRPFQGWRYLEPAKAPQDVGVYEAGVERPPEELVEALEEAGLL